MVVQNLVRVSNFKNLDGVAAINKIKELAEDASICMFNTSLSNVPCSTRPMALQEVDENGCIWFFSGANSDKNADIKTDDRVQLIFMNNASSEYLTLSGKAIILIDKNKFEELWTPIAKAWFSGGVDDPNLSLIKFTPDSGHYWDTKNNKFFALAKIAIGALTGTRMDDGVQGNVNP